jgi:hypothetical protein
MKRVIRNSKYAAYVLLFALVGAQLIRPNLRNPQVRPERSLWKDHALDPRVGSILRRACADCHSHETEWPWYSKISPVSWWLVRHVEDGRNKLNFSDWSGASQDQLEEIYDSVKKDKMPMSSYLLLHPQARLSKADRVLLLDWADGKLSVATR